MLTIESGHEGRFDFPRRADPPSIPYLLATVPRTGSSWVAHLLWATGCLGAPLEYLNFDRSGPYFFAAHSPEQQKMIWQSLLHRRTSTNGVFGLKCFPIQLQWLQENNPQLLTQVMQLFLPRQGTRRVIYLGRKDSTAHAISYARATLSGVWRSEQESPGSPQPEYSQSAVESARAALAGQAKAWDSMFADLNVEPLRLWYEDVFANPAEAIGRVADYLGVRIDPVAAIDVPRIDRQSQEQASEWTKLHSSGGTKGPEL